MTSYAHPSDVMNGVDPFAAEEGSFAHPSDIMFGPLGDDPTPLPYPDPVRPIGPQGPPGQSLLVGEGIPSALLGRDGDTYLDILTGNLYGPKANAAWPATPFSTFAAPALRFVHEQTVAATQWSIIHTLGGRPSVTIVDTADSVVIGDVEYVTDSQITVSFSAPFAGHAYLT